MKISEPEPDPFAQAPEERHSFLRKRRPAPDVSFTKTVKSSQESRKGRPPTEGVGSGGAIACVNFSGSGRGRAPQGLMAQVNEGKRRREEKDQVWLWRSHAYGSIGSFGGGPGSDHMGSSRDEDQRALVTGTRALLRGVKGREQHNGIEGSPKYFTNAEKVGAWLWAK